MTEFTGVILDYRSGRDERWRAPAWLLRLLAVGAMVAFPIFYSLFAMALIITPFLFIAGLVAALAGLAACAVTAAATFGSLHLIDHCLDRLG